MKTIYNVYVEIENQEQSDRIKQLCIDNGLPYINAFIIGYNQNWFEYDENIKKFLVTVSNVVG